MNARTIAALVLVFVLVPVVAVSCSNPSDTDGRGGSIGQGTTVNGSLTSSDNAVPPDRVAPYSADLWNVALTAGQPVSISMCRTSTNLDPFLSLFDANSQAVPDGGVIPPLASNDDGAGNFGALIQFTPTASGMFHLYAQDCCNEPVMDDRLNRDYTIQMVMGTVNLQCPAVGDAGGDMDATTEAGDDASGME